MSRPIRRIPVATLCAGALALASFTAQADVAACRALTGFDTAAGGVITGGGLWATITASRASFLGNKSVANCEVPVVTSSGKAKPDKTIFFAGPMTQDECSLYKYTSSIDSKLATGKVENALSTALSMVAKVDGLGATGKLVDPGYTDVRAGAAALEECIALLP